MKRSLRQTVLERDDHTCKECGATVDPRRDAKGATA
jgi:5-methylcytosine-specific restriction endonuclease McrA